MGKISYTKANQPEQGAQGEDEKKLFCSSW